MTGEFIWFAPVKNRVFTNAVSTDQENLPEAKVELQPIVEQKGSTNMSPTTQFVLRQFLQKYRWMAYHSAHVKTCS